MAPDRKEKGLMSGKGMVPCYEGSTGAFSGDSGCGYAD